jgi:type IV pilus assembly protein PilV
MTTPRLPSREAGMSLVEVLVTLVLISVGLLGVAALQINSMRANKEAAVRTQASMLAAAMMDRIRTNQGAFKDNLYTIGFDGQGAAGTPAGDDIAAWQQQIDQMMPGGAAVAGGAIQRAVIDDAEVATITITWSERADDATYAANGNKTNDLPTFSIRSEI